MGSKQRVGSKQVQVELDWAVAPPLLKLAFGLLFCLALKAVLKTASRARMSKYFMWKM